MLIFAPRRDISCRPPPVLLLVQRERAGYCSVSPSFLPGSLFFPASPHIPFTRGAGGNIWLYLRLFAIFCI